MASRFPPRDRSPPPSRYGDRGPPPSHGPSHIPSGPRGNDDVNSTPLGRDPPRGPKALIDSSRGGHFLPSGPRGRGFPGRNDFRDRDRDRIDPRDLRDGPPPRRGDGDRDWPRRDRGFDSRDSHGRMGFGRGRSRSPPMRDFRDSRDSGPRELDIPRLRRNSRDGPISLNTPLSDLPPLRGGSMRGRGRGDRDRGRGRGMPLEDRDLFRGRSRSRDGWRDVRMDRDRDRNRDPRDRDRDRDRMLDRELDRRERFDRRDRDDDRWSQRDDRDRFERAEPWKKDRPPARIDTKTSGSHSANPSSAVSQTPTLMSLGAPAVGTEDEVTATSATAGPRKAGSTSSTPRESRRPSEKTEHVTPIRTPTHVQSTPAQPEQPSERPTPQFSPSPAAPEVPAFGSLSSAGSAAAALTETAAPEPSRKLSQSDTPRERPDLFPSTPIKPPTAPRADRVDAQQRPDRSKTEVPLRSSRPPSASPVIQPSYMIDHSHPVPALDRGIAHELAPQSTKAKDTHASSNEQEPDLFPSLLGPPGSSNAATPSSTRASSLPTQPQPQPQKSPPPHSTSLSPNSQHASIPTGPRAQQQRSNGQRPGAKSSNQWVRPGYVNRRMSATNSPSSKRDLWDEGNKRLALESPFVPEGPLSHSGHGEEEAQPSITPVNGNGEESEKREKEKEKASSEPAGEHPEENETRQSEEEIQGQSRDADNDTKMLDAPEAGEIKETEVTQEEPEQHIPMLFDEPSDQQSDDDDALDEEDFNQSEQRFEKEMLALKSEIPLPPLQDPVVVDLLMKIQMLGMIADGAAPANLDQPGAAVEVESPDKPVAIIPLSGKEAEEVELAEEVRPIENAAGTPVTIPIIEAKAVESLPFLPSGPPTPFSDMETLQENYKLHERIKDSLLEDIIKQRSEVAKQHAVLREQYSRYYKAWRLKVRDMDKRKSRRGKLSRNYHQPLALARCAALPVIEGRRGYKLNSELDFQLALKASAITAQEESERRRDQEATVHPDMTREARIPDMLDEYQKKASLYQDTNQMVDPADAFTVFAFHPPPNDFTPEEHKAFTEAFMAHPKKWGKIAELLPGRTFQQCVMHYYSTKEEIKYKAKLNKKWTRKGRARKTARAPRSNALMADLGIRPAYDADDAETPVVTDTGRPRHAAAPTFGESNADTESNTPTPASGKRGGAKDPGDQPAERASGRRAGRGGGGGRGGRRGRGGGQQAASRAEPAPPTTAAAAACANTLPAVAPLPKPEADAVESLVDAMLKAKEEIEKPVEEAVVRSKPSRGSRNKEQQQQQQPAQQQQMQPVGQSGLEAPEPSSKGGPGDSGYGSLQPTSYWSVPEVKDFPDLVAHFGKDFDAISQFMKTKTPTMVKNYFQRRVDGGKTELEEVALIAEAKKLRGEPTGPLPTPSVSSQRRYEATPSSITPRALAPNMEHAEMMDRTLAPKAKPSVINMAPAPAVIQPRQGMEKDRSQPKLYPLVQAPASQPNLAATSDELHQRSVSTSQLTQPHRNQQGPRMGYFTDERRESRPPVHIAAHMSEQDVKPIPSSLTSQVTPGMPLQTLPRQNPNVVPQTQDLGDIPRYGPLSQPPTFPQGPYLQPPGGARNTSTTPQSHSRRSSRTIPSAVTSPVQRHIKLDTDPSGISAMERPAPIGPPAYLTPGHPVSVGRQGPTLTPPTDHGRPRITAAPVAPAAPEPQRQVPAKRSNIMSILNDEPEEPQPRKKFASEQSAPPVAIGPPSPSRPVYQGRHSSSSQPGHSEDQHHYQRQQQYYSGPSQPQHHQQQQQSQVQSGSSGQYAEPPPTSTRGSTTDWMARFDPREQQQSHSSSSTPSISRPPSYSHGFSGSGPHAPHSVSGLQHMSDQSQAASQPRQSFSHQPLQQPPVQGLQDRSQQPQPHLGPAGRESPGPRHIQAHPHTRSPVQRHNAPYSSKVSQQRSTSPLPSGPGNMNPHVSQMSGYNPPGVSHHKAPQSQHQPGPPHLLSQSHQHGMHGSNGSQYGPHVQQLSSSTSRHAPPPSVMQQEQQAHQHQHLQHQHQHQRSHQPQPHPHHQHHQHQPSLSLSQRSNSPFGHSPHMTPQQVSHTQGIPRAGGPLSSSNAPSHPGVNMGRSYTPPSNLGQHHLQNGSSSGLPYSNTPSHPLHQSGQGNNLHQQHIRPRHGSGGPPPSGPGHHNIYPQEPRQ
ncbi:hypothetical protein TESG_00428 [Trichophyton tonsurans CBS 112818]|uniref:SANT domain-containing protein n=1 Tax=Trichophyton tonsurans (strain CBS 112818) TaxID=647933 RepID=F2RNG0_TRIT1|nr:hypothetical protein TESG_00428 [Trichophyton tonsurans CBS 112818]